MSEKELEERFRARAEEIGATVHQPMEREEVVAIVDGLVRAESPTAAIVAPDLDGYDRPIHELLAKAGVDLTATAAADLAATAMVGISKGVMAVAETGSVLLAGNDLLTREASMLPLIHILLVPRTGLVDGLEEVGRYLKQVSTAPECGPIHYASLVSGPSRTSDVEKTLTIGVHGPRQLHIILTP